MVNELIQNIKTKNWPHAQNILQSFEGPSMAAELDTLQRLPLHHAIRHNATDKFIYNLIQANEGAVRHPTTNNDVPLHLAVFYGASAYVLESLIRQYPEALLIKNNHGYRPMDHINRGTLDKKAEEILCRPLSYWMDLFDREEEKREMEEALDNITTVVGDVELRTERVEETILEMQDVIQRQSEYIRVLEERLGRQEEKMASFTKGMFGFFENMVREGEEEQRDDNAGVREEEEHRDDVDDARED